MTEIQRTPGNAKGRCRMVSAGEFIWTVATAGGQGNTVAEQTQVILAQLEANLLVAGSGKERIVEAVVYLTDMNKKAEMDAVWCDWIPADGWPNRACVRTALAPGALVPSKAMALKPGSSPFIRSHLTYPGPAT